MNETSLSLLAQLQESDEADSWARFARLYTPLITAWLRKYDVQNSDIDDLMQDVLLAVSKDLPRFERRGPGAFRGWMKGILVNRLRNFWRSRDRRPLAVAGSDIDARLAQLDDPTSQQTQIWNRHRMMNRTVALKVIKGEFVRRPESVDRFQREITAAAQLAHPNIVTAYDAEQAEDVHYLVMEHVDGVDLARMILQRGHRFTKAA